VTRQAVHRWIARYEAGGLAALADRSHRPHGCSHQISPELEAMICELRRQHPGWGPRRILHQFGRQSVGPLPGRSNIYRCPKAPQPHRAPTSQEEARRVPALGARPSDAAVADGRHGRGDAR
jgi:hypothetical protein